MQYQMISRELQKVRETGTQTLDSLYQAREKLNRKRNQKFLQLTAKIPGHKKRSELRKQETLTSLMKARQNMEAFQNVLQEPGIFSVLPVDIQCFLFYADFFFYEPAEEYLKPAKLEEARLQVEEAIERVREILLLLKHI